MVGWLRGIDNMVANVDGKERNTHVPEVASTPPSRVRPPLHSPEPAAAVCSSLFPAPTAWSIRSSGHQISRSLETAPKSLAAARILHMRPVLALGLPAIGTRG